jgi:hypothetical protein
MFKSTSTVFQSTQKIEEVKIISKYQKVFVLNWARYT